MMKFSMLAAVAALAAPASAGGFDVLLRPDRAAGVLRTGSFDDATTMVVSEHERVFKGDFGAADPTQPNFSDEPGFRALDGAFTAGESWGFNITDRALRWNTTTGAFDQPSPFSITLSFAGGALSATTPTQPGEIVPGFSLLVPGGGFDNHLDLFLNAGEGAAAIGIYLLRLNVFGAGLAASDNIWFVLNRGLSEAEHERAEHYVRDVLVPTPGTGVLAVGGLVAVSRRRRG